MKIIGVLLLTLVIGCTTGGSHIVNTPSGDMRVDHVGHTGLLTQGAGMSEFYKCSEERCIKIGEYIGANPTIAEQLAGPAAMVGSAKLLSDGIRESGDSITNTNQQRQKQGQFQIQRNGAMRGWTSD